VTSGGLKARWAAIRSSYWFVPSLMALAAVLLGILMIWFDAQHGASWIEGLSWYQQVRSDGARAVLSTIAGSMITVAGVVFSITIVALSYASSQYGPRVLTNFMSDRGNTVTLGTFVATFLYCLVVLRTIRGGDEDFVPQYAVLVAMLLAICSIGVLIYFIHHVLRSIHINNVAARIGERLIDDVARRFPVLLGDEPTDSRHSAVPTLSSNWQTVCADVAGYIQSVDEDALIAIAAERDFLITLRCRPGDFVSSGRTLAEVSAGGDIPEHCLRDIRACFTQGDKRTPDHDLMFLVSELVEIAARALSPGVNDPMTAVTCLDWLGAGGREYARRSMPSPARTDDRGCVRLVAMPNDLDFFLSRSFARLRAYAAKDAIAANHLLQVLGDLAAGCSRPDQVDGVRREARLFAEQANLALDGPDGRAVQERATELQQVLASKM
jgi:uncharacterized membrane protein